MRSYNTRYYRLSPSYNKDIRKPLSVVTAYIGYDSEDNHVLVGEQLHTFSVIPAKYRHVPLYGKHMGDTGNI